MFTRCDVCGRFMSYKDMKSAVVSIPFGGYHDLEPKDENFIHKKCWNKMTKNNKKLTRKISWQFSLGEK